MFLSGILNKFGKSICIEKTTSPVVLQCLINNIHIWTWTREEYLRSKLREVVKLETAAGQSMRGNSVL